MSMLGMYAATTTQHVMSPRLQRAVRLLQMSSQDFAQVVRGALDSNPFLDEEEYAGEVDISEPPAPEVVLGESESWGFDTFRATSHGDSDSSVFDTMEDRPALPAHLFGQLRVLPLPDRDLALAFAVVESLDDDGYLRLPLDEVPEGLVMYPAPEHEELSIALRRVQALDPAGVGARSLAECLELQLPSIACGQVRGLATAIVRKHLDALASRDVRGLARKLGQEFAAVEAACAAIRRLDPHPGWRYSQPCEQYITPDVIVRKVRGQWKVTLNDAVVPRVKLNRSYVDLYQRHRDADHPELGEHLQEARWTVRNVEQRFSTILSVAQAILKRQHAFLAYGPMAIKPLALREIADPLDIHESTVSRVTNNKFLATPWGVFELKYFFSRGLATANGGECSPTAIRSLIQEMIAAEPKDAPLSDVDLARELGVQGLKVARRTVTKYRQLLRIEPAERRRAA